MTVEEGGPEEAYAVSSGSSGMSAGTANSAVEIRPGVGGDCTIHGGAKPISDSSFKPRDLALPGGGAATFYPSGAVWISNAAQTTHVLVAPEAALALAKEILNAHAERTVPTCADCGKPVPRQEGQVLLPEKDVIIHAACFKKRKDAEVGGDWRP